VAGGDSAAVIAGAAGRDVVLDDEAGLSELHAEIARTADAAHTTSPTEENVREKFTVATLHLGS
jgi:hypothetical protein